MTMKIILTVALTIVAMSILVGCNNGSKPSNNAAQPVPTKSVAEPTPSTGKALNEPKFQQEVADTDPCQPVRKQRAGAVEVFCKGKPPCIRPKDCGRLQSRNRGATTEYQDDDGIPYNSAKEYRCLCKTASKP